MTLSDTISNVILPLSTIVGPAAVFLFARLDSSSATQRLGRMVDVLDKVSGAGASEGADALREAIATDSRNLAIAAATRPKLRSSGIGLLIMYIAAIAGVVLWQVDRGDGFPWVPAAAFVVALAVIVFVLCTEYQRKNLAKSMTAKLDKKPAAPLSPRSAADDTRADTIWKVLASVVPIVATAAVCHSLRRPTIRR